MIKGKVIHTGKTQETNIGTDANCKDEIEEQTVLSFNSAWTEC